MVCAICSATTAIAVMPIIWITSIARLSVNPCASSCQAERTVIAMRIRVASTKSSASTAWMAANPRSTK